MTFGEAMAIDRLKKKKLGELIDENVISDIEILTECCNRLTRQTNELLVENGELKKLLEEEND